jgi:hypothetical protein
MEAADPYEMLVPAYQTTWRHMPAVHVVEMRHEHCATEEGLVSTDQLRSLQSGLLE